MRTPVTFLAAIVLHLLLASPAAAAPQPGRAAPSLLPLEGSAVLVKFERLRRLPRLSTEAVVLRAAGRRNSGKGKIIGGSVMIGIGAGIGVGGSVLLISSAIDPWDWQGTSVGGLFHTFGIVTGAVLLGVGIGLAVTGGALLSRGQAERNGDRRYSDRSAPRERTRVQWGWRFAPAPGLALRR